MKNLVDVNVLSERTKQVFSQRVDDWPGEHLSECVVDAVVMAEIWRGIDVLPDGRRKDSLQVWFGELKTVMPCLDWTLETALEWAPIVRFVKYSGFTVGTRDTMIAASAKRHGLTVATRNADDFNRCGVQVINPFE